MIIDYIDKLHHDCALMHLNDGSHRRQLQPALLLIPRSSIGLVRGKHCLYRAWTVSCSVSSSMVRIASHMVKIHQRERLYDLKNSSYQCNDTTGLLIVEGFTTTFTDIKKGFDVFMWRQNDVSSHIHLRSFIDCLIHD